MLTNNNGRKSRRGDRKYLQPFCSCFIVQQQIFSFTVNVRGAGVSLLGVLGGLLPQYDLRAWETARLEVKIFWRRFTNCDRRLKIQVSTLHTSSSKYKGKSTHKYNALQKNTIYKSVIKYTCIGTKFDRNNFTRK